MEKLYAIHFPSKLPEYLALGMPVVVVGPPSATGVRWAARNPEAAVLLDGSAPEKWSPVLSTLKDDADWRERLGRGAVAAGEKYFRPAAIRARFREILQLSARAPKNSAAN